MKKAGSFSLLAFVTWCNTVACQEKPAPKLAAVDTPAIVEVFLAKEHVPEGLKSGAIVDVAFVAGKSVTPKGRVSYATQKIATGVEVVSIATARKPKAPEFPILATLRVSKKQLPAIERMKTRMFTVSETNANGAIETKQMSATFRLELPSAAKKK